MTDLAALGLSVRSDGVVVASTKLEEFKGKSDQAARGADNLGKKSDALQTVLKRLAVVAGGALGGLASGAFFMSAVREAETFETTMFRVQAVIRATGGVAGRSADQLREQARGLALDTLESTEGILRAQQTLLTFRNVQGDVFDRAIVAAADMSAALGGDLNSSTMQLAKALENPVQGLTALTRSGTVFTEAQKEMVKAMVEAGNTAGAQAFILSELEAQYGGTARAAAQGLAGAQDTLGQRVQELKLALSEQLGLLQAATAANNALAGSVLFVTDNLPAIIDGLRVLGLVVVALASTQIPALVIAIGAKTTAIIAATTAAGVLTGALRVLGTAVALAGGPWGVLAALIVAAAGYFLMFRDNATEAEKAMGETKDAQAALNSALGVFYQTAAPEAARTAIDYANALREQAAAARDAAQSEVAKARAMINAQSAMGMDPEAAFMMGEREAAANRQLSAAERVLADANRAADRAVRAVTGSASQRTSDIIESNRELGVTIDLTSQLTDLMSGSGGGNGRSAAAAVDDVTTNLREAATEGQKFGQTMAGHFDGLITGGKNLSGVLQSMARQLESRGWQMLFSGMGRGGGGGGGLLGGLFGGIGKLFSFDGGGHTGNAPRSGGLDGKGGFMAMMHPRETVIDHTRGSGGGASRVDVYLHVPEGVSEERAAQIAGNVSITVMQGGAREQRKALAPSLASVNARGV